MGNPEKSPFGLWISKKWEIDWLIEKKEKIHSWNVQRNICANVRNLVLFPENSQFGYKRNQNRMEWNDEAQYIEMASVIVPSM